MNYQQVIQTSVVALGFDLVDVQFTGGGLLRVTIDWPWDANIASGDEKSITVDDCETVSKQLQYVLEVEGVEYHRLEVSSPGVDRPLRTEVDFLRFCGYEVDLVLKDAIGSAASGTEIAHNRKKFRGVLHQGEAQSEVGNGRWELHWSDAPKPKAGVRVSKHRKEPPVQVLGFSLDELQSAKLAPVLNFKSKNSKKK